MFLKTKYEYINSGFRLFKDLKTSYIKVLKLVSVFRELKFHCYPEEIQRSFSRSSRQEVFCKKGALRNSAEFTGKHLCQGLFFNKVAGLRTPFYTEHLWWLLLDIHYGINTYYIAFNIFSCRILIISYEMLIITGISIEKINQLIMYTIISRNVTIFYRQNWLPYFKCKKN